MASLPFLLRVVKFLITAMADKVRQIDRAAEVGGSLPGEEFVQLFSRHQRRLYLYILAQVPRPVEAEEILQETNIVIWRKFSRFEPGTNFFAWAAKIAAFEVLKYRDRRRHDRLQFSDEFLRHIAEDSLVDSDRLEDRRRALAHCLGKLESHDRELIQRRYSPGESGKSIAQSLGRPANSVYQSLGRIRRALSACIHRQLAADAG